jgi:hypothetical protein
MKTMNMVWLAAIGLAVIGSGCEQTTIVTISADTAESGAPFAIADAGDSAADSASLPLLAGAPCDDDFECASDTCMPSTNDYSAGYCFARSMDGCIAVTAPHPVKALCASATRTLYVCGDSWDIGLLGDCDDVAMGSLDEHYHCCKNQGAP